MPKWVIGLVAAGGLSLIFVSGAWVFSMDTHKRSAEEILDSLQRDVRENEKEKAARDAHEAAIRACMERAQQNYVWCEELLR